VSTDRKDPGAEIAIIGMACRFPGASTIEQFWRNLRDGIESLTRLSDDDLALAGIDPGLAGQPSYVRSMPILADIEHFDAAFFGYTAPEARIMDPQHRLFLECAWEAFERAGYDPESYSAPIGVFTGAKTNTYLLNLFSNRDFFRTVDNFQIALGNDLASLATRVSYKLNLRGPSYALHTACSTSLVAVHLACQSLLLDECRMALAGGVAVNVPHRRGYLYQRGGILSPDGSCRTFDAQAAGSNFGNGAGAVLLKRMEDALADGDHIHAVICGSATNNDGAQKASYTAPGVEGQTKVLIEAMACAGVDADTISCIEAHGTATQLGDSIEFLALTGAFRASTQRRGFCALGSVKTNIGHLETAAGVAGLIKTVLALEHRQIPPSLHFQTPNPNLDLERSPFFVNTALRDWQVEQGPRRAGVSSFGIGSTNAHVILEEAPAAPQAVAPSRAWQLLPLSARTAAALAAMAAGLAAHLRSDPDLLLADVAFTLEVGRRAFTHRLALLCRDRQEALTALEGFAADTPPTAEAANSADTQAPEVPPDRPGPVFVATGQLPTAERPVVFLFPGLGEHYPDMARGLYDTEPVFRAVVDEAAALLAPEIGLDLRQVLFTSDGGAGPTQPRPKPDLRRLFGRDQPADGAGEATEDGAAHLLQRTKLSQPALFVIEYALARLWMAWGVHPRALVGYSVGEYVAACVAGVLPLADTLRLVVGRAQLIEQLPAGAMTAVPLSAPELAPLLTRHGLYLAAQNGPLVTVVAGEVAAVEALQRELGERGVVCRRLRTAHAFHSRLLEPASAALTALVRTMAPQPPRIPYLSNLSGTWITAEQVTDPGYWARQMTGTVRFGDALSELLRGPKRILLEVGPGQSLSSLSRLHPDCDRERGRLVLASMRPSYSAKHDQEHLLATLGELWVAGTPVDWPAFAGKRRRRVPLPTYPFERQRFWVESGEDPRAAAQPPVAARLVKQPDLGDWFYRTEWQEQPLPMTQEGAGPLPAGACWVVLADAPDAGGPGLASRLAARLRAAGDTVELVVPAPPGERFARREDVYTVRPGLPDDYQSLLAELASRRLVPRRFVHLWGVAGAAVTADEPGFQAAAELGFYSLVSLAQAISRQRLPALRLDVVSGGLQSVTGRETVAAEWSTLLGPCLVIPQEQPNVICRSIDLDPEDAPEARLEGLWSELRGEAAEPMVAFRGGVRWRRAFIPQPLPESAGPVFRQRGVYLITGGLGGIGLVLARYLARTVQARLVLTRRSPLPDGDVATPAFPATAAPPQNRAAGHFQQAVRELEEMGAEVLVLAADVADEARMREVLRQARERFGPLNGVIHAAGVLDPDTFKTVPQTTRAECEAQFRPKVQGLYVLERVLRGSELDFCLLYSSLSAILGGLGYVGYATANLFMDYFAHRHNRVGEGVGPAWLSVDWDSWHWQKAGADGERTTGVGATLVELALSPEEGLEAVRRVLAASELLAGRQLVVSTGELQPRLEQWVRVRPLGRLAAGNESGQTASPRTMTGAGSAVNATRGAMPAAGAELERRIAALWERLLGRPTIGRDDNFFDLGGNSLLGMQLIADLDRELGIEITPVELFESPTVGGLARRLGMPAGNDPRAGDGGLAPAERREVAARRRAESPEIAIIAMAGRFPGAASVEELWENLRQGRETISFFSDEELLAAGVEAAELRDPCYVKARPILEGVELFDAEFFGYSPREAELMDPQQRLFLECASEALELAGYATERYPGQVGVYAGASISSYMYNIYSNPDLVDEVGTFPILIGNEKDAVATRVSYKLNLRGPSLAVQTFCSTSLVAVHLACQGLLGGDCDMALAGGVSVILPQKSGYLYQEGGIGSLDGHIRAFDAKASGIVFGNGMGIVVLKRLRDALADGDRIHAVIRGSAVNNDGSVKAGYTATSVDGQAEVVRRALEAAAVDPETITYMEAHGTGTPLGDPIEVAALSKAFRAHTARRQFCALGSVKTNVGHLDRAAGVTGLIKAVLALEHELIPASLFFEQPNPNIDFANGPFAVNTVPREWKRNDTPRRAGVNSLGLGGTNAHVVLEEAPEVEPSGPSRPCQLLLWSARTESALERVTERLGDRLAEGPNLADVSFTLQVGRRPLSHRRMLLCRDRDEAREALTGMDRRRLLSMVHDGKPRQVVFLFPGLGGHYVGMGRGLYETEAVFREEIDRCAELLRPLLGLDLREVLYPPQETKAAASPPSQGVDLRRMLRRGEGEPDAATRRLNETWLSQPALFALEYALGRQWMAWGIHPDAMIGYSLGEYVASCLAGVMTLADALRLVAGRARLIQELPRGAMLAVPLAEAQVRPLLGEELSLAALNGPEQSVVAGPADAVAALERRLAAEGIVCRELQTTHAFHSRMMEPLIEPLADLVATVSLQPPRIPYISNLTGTWIEPEDATDPASWTRHLCGTVRFAAGMRELLREPGRILLEVGPGQTLGSLVLQQAHLAGDPPLLPVVLSSLPHSYEAQNDQAVLLTSLGKIWLLGGEPDWHHFYAGERRLRVQLPTYPFERQRYWIEPQESATGTNRRRLYPSTRQEVGDWFYTPSWKRSRLPAQLAEAAEASGWCLFVDGGGLGAEVARQLGRSARRVVTVSAGDSFARLGEGHYQLAPGAVEDYRRLLGELAEPPTHFVHLWNVGGGENARGSQELGFDSLLALGRALADRHETNGVEVAPVDLGLWVVSTQLHDVRGEEATRPEASALLGACQALPQELPHLRCHSIDLEPPRPAAAWRERVAHQLLAEIAAPAEPVVAYRGAHRWVPIAEPLSLPAMQVSAGAAPPAEPFLPPRLRRYGVYLLTQALTGVGFELARYLAQVAHARLVLVEDAGFPAAAQWPEWRERGGAVGDQIARAETLERLGAEVLVVGAELGEATAMRQVLALSEKRFGPLQGCIHLPPSTAGAAHAVAALANGNGHLRAQAVGLQVLDRLLRERQLDFRLLVSPQSQPARPVVEVAADFVLESLASQGTAHEPRALGGGEGEIYGWTSVVWDVPVEERREEAPDAPRGTGSLVIERLFAVDVPCQLIVSPQRLEHRWHHPAVVPVPATAPADEARGRYTRPELRVEYVAPRDEIESVIAGIWETMLGVAKVGIHDHFLELGGDSLLAARLVARLREALHVDLAMGVFFERPTIAQLAQAIPGLRQRQETAERLGRTEIEDLTEAELDLEILRMENRLAGDEESIHG
jgi:acyl transferase domain-containing protein/acyl carrier protein